MMKDPTGSQSPSAPKKNPLKKKRSKFNLFQNQACLIAAARARIPECL